MTYTTPLQSSHNIFYNLSTNLKKHPSLYVGIGSGLIDKDSGVVFPGSITEVRLWNQSRLNQLDTFYTTHVPPTSPDFDSLIGYWKFSTEPTFGISDSTGYFETIKSVTDTFFAIQESPLQDIGLVEYSTIYYLIGRTPSIPHQFYYRTLQSNYSLNSIDKPTESWTSWQKINFTINSDYVSPVVYLNRLYLFWAELHTESVPKESVSTSNTDTSPSLQTKATIKYSYQDNNGQWLQPQVVNKNDIIVDGPGIENNMPIDQACWQRVYVIPDNDSFPNRLLIFYGGTYKTDIEHFWTIHTEMALEENNSISIKNLDEIYWPTSNNNYMEGTFFCLQPVANDSYKESSSLYLLPSSSQFTANYLGSFPRASEAIIPQQEILGYISNADTLPVTYDYNSFIFKSGMDEFLCTNNTDEISPSNEEMAEYIPQTYNFGGSSNLAIQFPEELLSFENLVEDSAINFIVWINSSGSGSLSLTWKSSETNNWCFNCSFGDKKIDAELSGNSGFPINKASLNIEEEKPWYCLGISILNNGSLQITYNDIVHNYPINNKEYPLKLFYTPKSSVSFSVGFSVGCHMTNVIFLKGVPLTIDTFTEFQNYTTPHIGFKIHPPTSESDEQGNQESNSLLATPLITSPSTNDLEVLCIIPLRASDEENTTSPEDELKQIAYKMNSPIATSVTFNDYSSSNLINSYPSVLINLDSNTINNLKFNRTIRLRSSAANILRDRLYIGGVDELLSTASQSTHELDFSSLLPNPNMIESPDDGNRISFLPENAYGLYYQEIFFFIPWMIALQFNGKGQYKEAKQWYEYIFNPTAYGQASLWNYLPLQNLYSQETLIEQLDVSKDAAQIVAYENDPFDPFAIAALRPTAFQKAVVMNYIENLLDWGDQLFEQDTRETINEATTYYVMAQQLLGTPPVRENIVYPVRDMNYSDLVKVELNPFIYELENLAATHTTDALLKNSTSNSLTNESLYFGIPENTNFIHYWDLVKDRLYNIRHCMNIDGQVQDLALFQPPANPLLLAQSLVSGESLNSALSDLIAPIPAYRFNYLIEKAKNLVQMVTQTGSAFLAALEKKDAEALSLQQATNEVNLLNFITTQQQEQLQEAQEQITVLQNQLSAAQARVVFYKMLTGVGLLPNEQQNLDLQNSAFVLELGALVYRAQATPAYLLPNIFGVASGGMQFGQSLESVANILSGVAGTLNQQAGISATHAQYERRTQEWDQQLEMANYEVTTLNKQIDAATVRQQISENELSAHNMRIQQANKVATFLTSKFTNEQLYEWMIGQFADTYHALYQLAFHYATMAEKAFQYERCSTANFVQPTNWKTTQQGLLAGDALQLQLSQLEQHFIQQDDRRLEINKTISLQQLDPFALIMLKATGICTFNLPAQLFDYDFPGHYQRQIKSIAITIPAVVGPYQNIHATLSQTNSKTLLGNDLETAQFLLGVSGASPNPTQLRENWNTHQSIALSRGNADTGLFELRFEDPRYLPFEGTGAISSWQLEMPLNTNQFDFDTISDFIIDLNYTALDGGSGFAKSIMNLPTIGTFNSNRMINITQEFSSAWFNFVNPPAGKSNILSFTLDTSTLPSNLSNISIQSMTFVLALPKDETIDNISTAFEVEITSWDLPITLTFESTDSNNKVTIPSGTQLMIYFSYSGELQGNSSSLVKKKTETLKTLEFTPIQNDTNYFIAPIVNTGD